MATRPLGLLQYTTNAQQYPDRHFVSPPEHLLEIYRRQPQNVNYNPRTIRCLWHRPFRAVLGPTVLPYGYPS